MARTKPRKTGGKINRVVIGRKWTTITIRLSTKHWWRQAKRFAATF